MRIGLRRALFAGLTMATAAMLLVLATMALAPGRWSGLDIALLLLFSVTVPWAVIGFWNAVIGLVVMRLAADPVAAVFPAEGDADDDPLTGTTAILVCIRNEQAAQVIRNLEPMMAGLARLRLADHFAVYILSDTDDVALAAEEERAFGSFSQRWRDAIAVTYRRRMNNDGFKAGNIRDYCERYGARHDFAIPLDADSIMPAQAVVKLVRLMQRNPRIGILQSLVIGFPSTNAFTRIFQFGMRLGMRSYTVGSAWWQADCGPYWGHNAILRLAPFIAHCRLPVLAGGRPVLSHDQIEAVLMRRAGYEVRVLPREDLGFEQNPPTLLEFIRRDLRWCQGNMQYWQFLALPGLKLVSRCQLMLAILMFIGAPAWTVLVLAGTVLALLPSAPVDPSALRALFVITLIMGFMPKIATVIDVLCRRDLRRAYGGTTVLLAGVAVETMFSILLAPVMWSAHAIFLARLTLGRPLSWNAQKRDGHGVSFVQAGQVLWPQTAFGAFALACVGIASPQLMPYAIYFLGGLIMAVPFAVTTAWPPLGAAMARVGLCQLPEETTPPEILRELASASAPAAL